MKTLKVCPNCGRILQGPEFLISVPVIPQNIGLAFDAVAGRFLCPKCNFSGLPVEVKLKDYPSIKFRNKQIALPLVRGNPNYFRALILVGLVVIALSLFSNLLPPYLSIFLLILFAILWFYVEFRMRKYKE